MGDGMSSATNGSNAQPGSCPPGLIGRGPELARLRDLLADAIAGVGRFVLVSGEAGIGKSTLVATIEAEAHALGLPVAIGRCFDGGPTPYGPWVDLACNDQKVLAEELSAQPGADVATESRAELFERVRARLFTSTADTPTMVILEDLHWADEASASLLLHLVRDIPSSRLFLIGTYRDDELTPRQPLYGLLPELARAMAERVELRRWNASTVGGLVEGRYTLADTDARRLTAYLLTRGDGNPLFTFELLRTLEYTDALASDPSDGGWRLGDLGGIRVPSLIRQLVDSRFAHLDDATRAGLDVAAVFGHEVPIDLWQRVLRLDPAELDAVAARSQEAHMLEESPQRDGWRFTHALVRDAVYERSSLVRRRELHVRVAEAMMQQPLVVPALVAYHFQQAGDARASEWHLRAGEQAQTVYAMRAAAEHFTQALHLTGSEHPRQLLAARRARGRAYETLGEFERSRDDLETALALARQVQDGDAEWQTLLDLGLLWASRSYEQARSYYDRAYALAQTLDNAAVLARSLMRRGVWRLMADQSRESVDDLHAALNIFERLNDRQGIAEASEPLGNTYFARGDTLAALNCYERAANLFRDLGDRKGLIVGLDGVAISLAASEWSLVAPIAASSGDALTVMAEGRALAREIDWRSGDVFLLVNTAEIQISRGDYGAAMRANQEAIATAQAIEHRLWLAYALIVETFLYLSLFEFATARWHAQRLVTLISDMGTLLFQRYGTGTLARAAVAQGDLTFAEQVLDRCTDAHTPMDSNAQRTCWLARVELALARGDAPAACEIAERLHAAVPPTNGTPILPAVAPVHAAALRALGHIDSAESLLTTAQEIAAACTYRSLSWRLGLELGTLYHETGRHVASTHALDEARTILGKLAATIDDADLRSRFLKAGLARFPAHLSGARRPDAFADTSILSPREREVLRLVAEGMTDAEVAERLFISPRTVGHHLASIYAKLDAPTRTAATRLAIERGLI
jgi:DNA-binding CsgD family transcriptional regulator/tetratricopeptide (TPR) repeat protein